MKFFAMSLLMSISACCANLAHGAPTYTIGVENLQYYPLHTVRNGEYSGFARELLDAFAAKKGYAFKYVQLPINKLFPALLQENSIDFKYPDNPQWQPAQKSGIAVRYSAPVVVSEEGAMVLPEKKGIGLSRIKTLGTVLGFTPWPYKEPIDGKKISVVANGSFEGLLRDAMAGRLDAVYINVDVASAMLRDELKSPGKLVFDPTLPYARSDFSLSTVRYPAVIEEFNVFLKSERPMIEKLREKYGLTDHAREHVLK